MAETSTKPYMIRALYEWCCDNGYTPYLAVAVDSHTIVPRQHVKGGEIVLNVSPMATSRLNIGNEVVEFQARFSGVAQQISIPIGNISAIYARETGHGMAFDVSKAMTPQEQDHGGPGAQGAQAADGDDEAGGVTGLAAGDGGDGELADLGGAPIAPAGDGPPASGPDGEEPASGSRKRGVKGQASADVIAFAPSGGSKKKAPAPRAQAEQDADDVPASPEGSGVEDADPEPPPADGGGKSGKGGKARLTRVK
jgi:stringent starvation protein B